MATLAATDQLLAGDILVGSDSTLSMSIDGTSCFTGKTSGNIENAKGSSVSTSLGTVNVTMDDDALWVLTGDCSMSSLAGSGKINFNGHALTVGQTTYKSGTAPAGFTETSETAPENSGSGDAVSIADCTVSLSKTKYAYTGKSFEPTVTVKDSNGTVVSSDKYTVTPSSRVKAGKATVKVEGIESKGYTGSKTANFLIVPAKVSGVSAKSSTAGKVTVSWSKKKAKAAAASGYQVRCKVGGKVVNCYVPNANKASLTLKNLSKGKAAKVKVRAYVEVGSAKQKKYGSWSVMAKTTVKE